MLSDLLESLNEAQRQAVIHPSGPALVLAGAGSGKTRVLTTRVAWLMETQKIAPEEIMLVTFTNKAAGEMNSRVMQFTGHTLPFAGTFHRLCAKILRRDGYHIGLSPDYTIYDSDDQLSLIKLIYKQKGFNPKEFNQRAVKNAISTAKNEMLTWQEYEQFATGRFQEIVAQVYKLYESELRRQQAVDFDDLMLLVVDLFKREKTVLGRYQEQLSHVLVDEYQDTNKVQYQLTKFFAAPHNNIFVVGDFAQSIYAWRGADYRNMLLLQQDFTPVIEYRLEQNYRSTQTILDAATNVITKTDAHPILNLWTEKEGTDQLVCIETDTGENEAQEVVQYLRKHLPLHTYRDVAILYRTNAQSRPFEEAFVRAGIPYRLVGGFKFYERKEIKDLISYLRLALNPLDDVSRARAEKMGKRKLQEFEKWTAEQRAMSGDEERWAQQRTPLELLQQILTITEYRQRFDAQDPEDLSRLENIQELLNVASQFTEITTLLENIALVQDDYMADAPSHEPANAVTLMSLHSAKGLEFPVVFMVGMEEGVLPHSRSLLDKSQMEEERRLCYVGITRAQEQLIFTHARRRWSYGGATYATRSRFMQDIPIGLMKTIVNEAPIEHGYNQRNQFQQQWAKRTATAPAPQKQSPTGRHLVVDDDLLESLMNDEIDVKAFLDSA